MNWLQPRVMLIVLLFSMVMLTACGRAATPSGSASSTSDASGGKIVLTGSSTIAPLASELGKAFEAKHPGVRVDVQAGGSTRGVTDARQGTAEIGMVSRKLKDDEQDLLAFTIANDGVAPILHKSNPVSQLTDQQIIDIYLGKITNWKDVGGNDAPITVVNKAEGRSTLELFASYFKIEPKNIKAQVIIGDNQEGIKSVAGNPNAIGYVSIGTAEYEAEHGTDIKILPIQGVSATVENVRNASFPLSRPLNFVTKAQPGGLVKEFIDFARSLEAAPIIKEQFFVPLTK